MTQRLGFIHGTSGRAFVLDVPDLYRALLTIPAAFKVPRRHLDTQREQPPERLVRQELMADR
jgi:hypothetical protein